MKARYLIFLLALLLAAALPAQQARAQDPVAEAIKQGVKKVIVALDLKIQRIQNRTIWLQNAQKVLENTLSELRLTEIAHWTEEQRALYAAYYQELWEIKNAIAQYQRVHEIIRKQAALMAEYRKAYHLLRQDPNFTPAELENMYHVYTGILDESVKNLDQLLLVFHAHTTQMSDGKRLELIHSAADSIEQNYLDLQEFNRQHILLSLQRARERSNLQAIQRLYGLSTLE